MFRSYKLMLLVACLIVALKAYAQVRSEPPSGKTNVQVLMRDKLTHMQQLLDGLVTDDFDVIAEQAELLRIVGKAASWQAIDTPEYKTYSRRYTLLTRNLESAAADSNRDAALLQYLQLNISCVDCHQYIREQRWESNPLPTDNK